MSAIYEETKFHRVLNHRQPQPRRACAIIKRISQSHRREARDATRRFYIDRMARRNALESGKQLNVRNGLAAASFPKRCLTATRAGNVSAA